MQTGSDAVQHLFVQFWGIVQAIDMHLAQRSGYESDTQARIRISDTRTNLVILRSAAVTTA